MFTMLPRFSYFHCRKLNLMGCQTASKPGIATLRNGSLHVIDSLVTRHRGPLAEIGLSVQQESTINTFCPDTCDIFC